MNIENNNQEIEMNMYVYTNSPPDAPAESLLRMVYDGCLNNRIGMMRAKNTDTGKEELLLVGIELKPNEHSDTFPLAVILDADSVRKYVSPNGTGGWFEPETIVQDVVEAA